MSTLHGSWIKQSANSYFFLWGETWRTLPYNKAITSVYSNPKHPFCLHQSELTDFLKSHNLALETFLSNQFNLEKKCQQENITVPSQTTAKKKPIIPILSGQFLDKTVETNFLALHPWIVQGIWLTPLETIKFLRLLPLNSLADSHPHLGEDLIFWSHVYRWSLDLLSRRKFFPGIFQQTDGTIRSFWQPLLDSLVDQSRLAKLNQLMPRSCQAYQNDYSESQEILLGFLSQIIDTQVKQFLQKSFTFPKKLNIQIWLQSLSQANSELDISLQELERLENSLHNWTLPIQEYLVNNKNKKVGSQQFRTCLYLQPPTVIDEKSEQGNWQLKYYLQALDNSEILLDAETIWQQPVDSFIFQERTVEKPQETLLKGLGLASRLYAPIEESLQEQQPFKCDINPIQVYEFIRATAWQLQENGLGVILPSGLASGMGEQRLGIKIDADVQVKKGERLSLKSLLNFDIKLAIGEKIVSQEDFEKLLAQKSPLVEINGQWIALQPTDVRAAQAVLNQSTNIINLSVEDALRLSTGDTKTLAKLPIVGFEASGILQELINNLTNNQSIQPIEKPKDFLGELRPYQAKGVGWLAFLERWGLGACLADDMGLGKTPQLIAFVLTLKEQDFLSKPILVICPTSVLNNWEREVRKFAPKLSTFIHHGDKRSKGGDFLKNIKNKALVITSYALIYRDAKTLEQVEWQGIVLDEAQNIKNPQTKQSQIVRRLQAGFRIALTGTPVENRLSELWSILDFLNPGFLGTQQFFQRRFAIPIEKYGDRESLETMRSLVRPFILRRLKTDKAIIQDLPEKQEMNVFCGLAVEQAKLYQKLVDESLSEIEEATGIQRRGMILTLLLKLKQLCNHPAQFLKEQKIDSSQRSGKLLRLEEMLEEVIEENDRALIFTQFSEWGKLLQPYLAHKLNQEILFLYGGTRSPQRQEMIDRFQYDPDGARIFILSLKAGGTGLNLTRANHVFHVDRWWNPAVENQATDRAFRIGQKRDVQVHKFVCTGTLEERINDMIESKKQLADQTVDAGENWLTELDTDQLRTLLLLDRDSIIDEAKD